MKENLDPIQRADIIREQVQILDNSEGVTQDIINRANNLLLHAEEQEANYIAELDYISDQEAKTKGHITESDLEDMLDGYMADDCNREET